MAALSRKDIVWTGPEGYEVQQEFDSLFAQVPICTGSVFALASEAEVAEDIRSLAESRNKILPGAFKSASLDDVTAVCLAPGVIARLDDHLQDMSPEQEGKDVFSIWTKT